MTSSKMWGWVLAGVVGLAAPSVVGCKKDKGSDSSEKSSKADKDDKGSKKKSGDDDDVVEKYARGDVLKHVPKACKGGRVYLNLGLLLKNEAVEKSASALTDKMSSSMKKKDSKAMGKALKSLKKSGIDPARDVEEVAVCVPGKDEAPVVAIGGEFAGKKPLDALKKATEEADDSEPVSIKETDDGIKYLKQGKSLIGQIAPNVLVFTEDKDAFADLKKDDDESADWGLEKGRIVAFKVKDKKSGNIEGTIDESGEDLDVKFSVDLAGEAGEKAADNPTATKEQLEQVVEMFAKRLKKGPFKKVANDVAATKVKVKGSKVTLSMTLPASDLGDAIRKAAEASDDELKDVVDL